jgi:ATP-dependent DNA helicase RecQ
MSSSVTQSLKQYFGFSGFRDGQEDIVAQILSGQNLLAVMPTGAGKSLCYQLPAMLLEGRTIVVSPLIALMNDQVAYLQSLNLPADKIHSHSSYDENAEIWRRFARGDIKILYISPERLMTERMLAALESLPIDLFVVDEAHCISKWGAGFRPEYEQLSALQHRFPKAILTAFTATADKATRQDIVEKLANSDAGIIVKGFDRPNLSLSVALKEGWKNRLLAFVEARKGLSGIVYTLSRKETETVAALLCENGHKAIAYHAGQEATLRQTSQDRFMSEDGVVMVATIAFGMGIDKPDIRYVVHTNLPSSVEAFYQEIGRAGRDGAPADTLLIFGLDDLVKRRRMIADGDGDSEHKLRENKRLDSLLAYCEASACRKRALLAYFNETIGDCGNCDNCTNPPEMFDGTREAQILLSAILRTGEYFGAVHVVNVVRGQSSDKIEQRGHDQIITFGKGADQSADFWQAMIRQLLAAGHLYVDLERYGALRVTPEGHQILNGETEFACKKIVPRPVSAKKKVQAEMVRNFENTGDQSLLAQLKTLRLDLAREKNAPAYVIFSDRVLIEMVQQKPETAAQMLALNGVGPQKLEQYGALFLAAIEQFREAEAPG